MTLITIIALVSVAIIAFVLGIAFGAYHAGKMIRDGKIKEVKFTG